MTSQRYKIEPVPGVNQQEGEYPEFGLPVILLATRTLAHQALVTNPGLGELSRRFDLRLVTSTAGALVLSREVRSTGGRVALLLSDLPGGGPQVLPFISAFNQDWPDAGLHIFDALEGRVIFTEPHDPASDRPSAIRIESNGHEFLDARLVLKMVERYFPAKIRT